MRPIAAALPMRGNGDFMTLWSAEAVSEFGSAMSVLVFPLIGYALTGSARDAGLATTGVLLAGLAAALPAGVVVDRTARRAVLVGANLVAGVAFTALAVAALTHVLTLWLLVSLGSVSGAAGAFVAPANAAAIRLVVPKEQLPEALAQSQARTHAARLAGPPAGGALYSLARGLPFVVDALTWFVAAALIRRVRHRLPAPPSAPAPAESRPSALRTLRDGLRFIARTPSLRAMMTWAALINFGGAYLSVLITLRLVRAGVAPVAIGTVDTIAAAAGLLGAVFAPALVRRARTGVLTATTGVIGSAALFCTAFTTDFVLVGLFWAAAAVLNPANNTGISAYMSAVVPDALQGRAFSAMGLIANGPAPLAPLLAGVVLGATGGLTATTVGALIGLAALVPIVVNRQTRTLGRPANWPETAAT